jgi:predicted component of type VI protein secretion system
MKLTVQNIQQMMGYLRNVAEVDPNDQISNAASSLAYRLEAAGTSVFDLSADFDQWTPLDQETAKYAIRKRDQYVLLPGNKHAVDLKRVEKQRRTLK